MSAALVEEACQQLHTDVQCLMGLNEARAAGTVDHSAFARARTQIKQQLVNFKRATLSVRLAASSAGASPIGGGHATMNTGSSNAVGGASMMNISEQRNNASPLPALGASFSIAGSARDGLVPPPPPPAPAGGGGGMRSKPLPGPHGDDSGGARIRTRSMTPHQFSATMPLDGARSHSEAARGRQASILPKTTHGRPSMVDSQLRHQQQLAAADTVPPGFLKKPVLHPVDPATAQAAMKLRRGYSSSKEIRRPTGTKLEETMERTMEKTMGSQKSKRPKEALQPISSAQEAGGVTQIAQLETSLAFVRECDEQAAALLRLGLCRDAKELFLDSAEPDVQQLRLIAEAILQPASEEGASVGSPTKMAAPAGGHHGGGGGGSNEGPRKNVAVPDDQLPIALQAFHRVSHHDLIKSVIEFYEILNSDPHMDTIQQTVITASCQIENVVQLLYRITSVPALLAGNTPAVFASCVAKDATVGEVYALKDLIAVREEGVPIVRFPDGSMRQEKRYRVAETGYHIIFNGTIYVYEMNMYLLRRVQNCAMSKKDNGSEVESTAAMSELYRMCINHVAACIELCETRFKTIFKLATVKFLPWRLQMFDFLMQCFEQMEMYTEAFQVAQQAAHSVRFLQELEFMDPVPPPAAWLKVLENAVHHTMLQMMRYGWYDIIANAMRQSHARTVAQSGGGNDNMSSPSNAQNSPSSSSVGGLGNNSSSGFGAHNPAIVTPGSPAATFGIAPEHAAAPISAPIPLPVPKNGRELLDLIWRVVEKAQLPSTGTAKKSDDEHLKSLMAAATASSGRGNKKSGNTAAPVTMEQVEVLIANRKAEEAAQTRHIARQFQQHVIPYLVGFLVFHGVEEEDGSSSSSSSSGNQADVLVLASPSFSAESPMSKSPTGAAGPGSKSGGGGGGKLKELNGPPPFILSFKGMRRCALEALEILLQYMSISYFIHPNNRYDVLRSDGALFPFPVCPSDDQAMEQKTLQYLEEASALPPEPVEPVKTTRSGSVRGGAGKKGKRGGKGDGKGAEKSVAAALQQLLAPPRERSQVMDDPVFISTVRFENYFPLLNARFAQLQRGFIGFTTRSTNNNNNSNNADGDAEKDSGSAKKSIGAGSLDFNNKKKGKATSNNPFPADPKIILTPEDEIQKELMTLMRTIRYLYSTKQEALFYRCCALFDHVVRGTISGNGGGSGGMATGVSKQSMMASRSRLVPAVAAGGTPSSRPDSRMTVMAGGEGSGPVVSSTATWNRLAFSAHCMIRMLQSLKYSTLTIGFQRRTLRVDEITLQGQFYVPPEHPYLHFFLRAGGYHPSVAKLLREAKRAEDLEAAQAAELSTAHAKKGKNQANGASNANGNAAGPHSEKSERLLAPEMESAPAPPHPYPLVSPLVSTASALRALANSVGHGGASTRYFPEAPILATSSSISVAVANLYEEVIQMVGKYLLQAATDSIQYRRNERALRVQLGITAVPFHDPEGSDDSSPGVLLTSGSADGFTNDGSPRNRNRSLSPESEVDVESRMRMASMAAPSVEMRDERNGGNFDLASGLLDHRNSTDGGGASPDIPMPRSFPVRLEDDVDEEEERAYFHVVVNAIDGMMASGLTNEMALGEFAINLASSALKDLAIVREKRANATHEGSASDDDDEKKEEGGPLKGRHGQPPLSNTMLRHHAHHSKNNDSDELEPALDRKSKKKKKSVLGSVAPVLSIPQTRNPREAATVKLLERSRLALAFVKVSLAMVTARQKRLNESRSRISSSLNPIINTSTTGDGRPVLSAAAIKALQPESGSIGMIEEAALMHFAGALRDCRTYLTRLAVELRYHVACLRAQVAVYVKHQEDIVQLFIRQSNTKVFGAVTAKDSRILQTLLSEDPELPDTAEEEESKLLSWSFHDPALRSLVLLCLANVLPSPRHRRERLNTAMDVMDKQLSKTPSIGDSYSTMIIWSFAASTAGKLRATQHGLTAKHVLYQYYLSASSLASLNAAYNTKKGEMSVAEITQACNLTTNERVLESSSEMALLHFSGALLDLSTEELDASYRRKRRAEKENPPDVNAVAIGAVTDWEWTREHQLTGLLCAYRVLLALRLLERVSSSAASALVFPCVNLMYNSLLPCLRDKHFSRHFLTPLVAMAYAMLDLEGEGWSDPSVQFLALRILNAFKTNLTLAGSAGSGLTPHEERTTPQLTQLLYLTFAHVWNQIYLHPNMRQTRYFNQVTMDGMRCRYVFTESLKLIQPEEEEAPVAEAKPHGKHKGEKANRGREAAEAAAAAAAEAEAKRPPELAVFTASQFIPSTASPHVYDQMPVEMLELMEELLFHDPIMGSTLLHATQSASSLAAGKKGMSNASGGAAAGGGTAAGTAGGKHGPSSSSNATSAAQSHRSSLSPGRTAQEEEWRLKFEKMVQPEALLAIPPIIAETVTTLAATTSASGATPVVETLAKYTEDILYPKATYRAMEFLIRMEDFSTARRLGLNGIEACKKWEQDIRKFIFRLHKGFFSWLALNGYILADSRRIQEEKDAEERRKAMEASKKKGKGRKSSSSKSSSRDRSSSKKKQKLVEQAEDAEEDNLHFLDLPRVWNSAEEQMLRQMTRALGWMRRRRADRFLYRRVTAFYRFVSSQIRLYLATIAKLEVRAAERRKLYQEERLQYINARNVFCSGGTGVMVGEGKSSGGGANSNSNNPSSGPNSARNAKKTGIVEVKEDTVPFYVTFVQHCANAAAIFNNAFLSSHSMRAVGMAVNELRNYTLANVPDALMLAKREDHHSRPSTTTNEGGAGDSKSRSSPDQGSRPGSPATPGPTNSSMDPTQYIDETSMSKLKELGPLFLRLATELLYSLTSIQRGYCDHRRDIEVIQPPAMKAGLFTCLAEQIHFQGMVPSLYSVMSPAGQFEEHRIARLAPREHEKSKRIRRRRLQECADGEWKSREACIKAYYAQLYEIVNESSLFIPSLQKFREALQPMRETASVMLSNQGDAFLTLHSYSHRNGEAYCTIDAHEAHATLRRAAMNCPPLVHFPFEDTEEGFHTHEARVRQLQLGQDMPEEIIIEMVLFLASCMQFFSQREAIHLCILTNELTQHRFAELLLPIAISIEDAIGMRTPELIAAYETAKSGAQLGRTALAVARMNWKWYTYTPLYQRALQRLSRTLLPSLSLKNDPSAVGNPSAHLIPYGSEATRPASNSMTTHPHNPQQQTASIPLTLSHQFIGAKAVLSSYHRAASRLRELRDFASLSECLLEMGQVYLLHRNKSEAESCWLEALDAALEIPRVFTNWRQTINGKISIESIGLTRMFISICTLSSLAMYVYREDQGKAVDCYLLATALVRQFFKTGTSLNFPARLYDFTDFNMNDFVVAPYLEEALRPKVADVSHHLLFISHQLQQFGYHIFACMMASLTEFFAMRFEKHVHLLTEARLIHAKGAACAGNFGAAMRILRTICQGAQLPTPAFALVPIPESYPTVECHGATTTSAPDKKLKGPSSSNMAAAAAAAAGGDGPGRGVNRDGERRIYDDRELPTSPFNVHSIFTFMGDCFPNLSMDAISGTATSSHSTSSQSNTAPGASTTPSAFLHEAVCERYGTLLSRRIIISVAEVLITLGGREAAYLWPYDISSASSGSGGREAVEGGGGGGGGSGRRPPSRENSRESSRPRRGSLTNSNLKHAIAPVQRTACIEALKAGEYLLEPFLQKEILTTPASTANPAFKAKGGKAGNVAGGGGKHGKGGAGGGGLDVTQDSTERTQMQQRIEETACLRHHAIVLKAAAMAERGNCRLSTELLEGEINEYNRLEEDEEDTPEDGTNSSHHGTDIHRPSTLSLNPSVISGASGLNGNHRKTPAIKFGSGFETQAVPNLPSFLLSLSHTHWCKVLHGLTVNYFRLRAFRKMEKAAQQAILLCERCHDPYSARIFSLYRATALAQTGYLKEAIETIRVLEGFISTLAVDGADPLDAWTIMSMEWLRRMVVLPECAMYGAGTADGLLHALQSLKCHAEFCGLLNWFKQGEVWRVKNSTVAGSIWNCHVTIKLHTVMNATAEMALAHYVGRRPEVSKVSAANGSNSSSSNGTVNFNGIHHPQQPLINVFPDVQQTSVCTTTYLPNDLSGAIDVLEQAIQALSRQYDTAAHPSNVVESKLRLAQALLCAAQYQDLFGGGGSCGGSRHRQSLPWSGRPLSSGRPHSGGGRPRSGASSSSRQRSRPVSGNGSHPPSARGPGSAAGRLKGHASHRRGVTDEASDSPGGDTLLSWKFCSNGEMQTQEETIAALPDTRLQRVCQLLLEVAESVVVNGTHDFRVLRLALLELATMLSRCGTEFSGVAASCAILAHLVLQMTQHVFSGANAFHLYNTDEAMVTDLNALRDRFPDFVMAAIQATVSGVGQLTEQMTTPDQQRLTVPISTFYAELLSQDGGAGGKRNAGSSRLNDSVNNRSSPEITGGQVPVSVQDIAYTFATLHREKGLYVVAPPIEALDHETACLQLRAYLQEKTTAPSCTYLCFPEEVRRQCAKQLTPLRGNPQQGTTNRSSKNKDNTAALQQQDNIDFWTAIVPPVVLKVLPPNFFTTTGPDSLGAPKINTVVTQSFTSASYDLLREGCETLPGTEDGGMVTLLLSISPYNDPTLTQPPSIATAADRKKLFGSAENNSKGKADANPGGRPTSSGAFKNRLAAAPVVVPESRFVCVDAALQDRLQELSAAARTDSENENSRRGLWTCVSFELARKVVEELHHQALQVLHWYEVADCEKRKNPHGSPHGASKENAPMDGGQVGGLSQASLSGGNGNGVNINNTNAEYSSKVSPAVSVATVNTVSSKASASSKGNPAGNSAPQNGAATGQAGTPAAANLMMTLNTSLAALQNKLNLQQQQQQSGPGGNRKGGVAAKGIVLENAASAIVSGGGNSNSGGGGAGGASSSSPSGGGGSGSGLPGGPQQPMSGSKQPYLLCDLSERYFQQQQAARTAEAHNISRSLDESKSLLLMNLIESIIKSYVARSMADEALMESCIQQLLPTCALTREVVEFLASWLANDGGAAKFFHPGVHEWMRKIGNFIQKTRKVA